MEYTLLKDVTQDSHHCRICATMMDAQIPERHLPLFTPLLKEDSLYYLKYFEVANARPSYRPFDNEIMARFTAHIKVTEIAFVPERFPTYACNLVSFETLRTRINDRLLLSDAIGPVTTVSHIDG